MIYCPICQVAVADVTSSGLSEGVCPRCLYRYGAITGQVVESVKRRIPHPTRTRLAWELRINRPDGARSLVEFEIPGGEDRVIAREGDSVTVVYTKRGDAFEAVVSVTNNTTRTSSPIVHPAGEARKKAARWAAIVATPILFLGAAAVPPGMALLIAATSGFASYLAIESATSLRVKKGSPAVALAARDAGLSREETRNARSQR